MNNSQKNFPFNPSTNINNLKYMNNNNQFDPNNAKIKELNQKILILEEENLQLKNRMQNYNQMNNLIYGLNQQLNDLKNKLKQKEKELKEISNKLANYENIIQYDNLYNLITINFKSGDGKIDYKIKCLNTDTFASVEERLYQKYEEYRNTNNTFIVNGNKILRFKKIYENKIKDGEIIQLQNLSNIGLL